jgi:hypothetical protein
VIVGLALYVHISGILNRDILSRAKKRIYLIGIADLQDNLEKMAPHFLSKKNYEEIYL